MESSGRWQRPCTCCPMPTGPSTRASHWMHDSQPNKRAISMSMGPGTERKSWRLCPDAFDLHFTTICMGAKRNKSGVCMGMCVTKRYATPPLRQPLRLATIGSTTWWIRVPRATPTFPGAAKASARRSGKEGASTEGNNYVGSPPPLRPARNVCVAFTNDAPPRESR